MRLFNNNNALLCIIIGSFVNNAAVDASPSSSLRGSSTIDIDNNNNNNVALAPSTTLSHRRLQETTTCSETLLVEKDYEDRHDESYIVCEVDDDGISYKIDMSDDEVELHKNDVANREVDLVIPANTMLLPNGEMDVPSNSEVKWQAKSEKDKKKDKKKENKKKNDPWKDRRLAVTETSDKRVLVVRVKAPDSQTTASQTALSDSVFGNGRDPLNLKSQYEACSHNKLIINKAVGSGISNGAITTEISQTVNGVADGTVRNAVLNALNTQLGENPCANIADHVMLCLPPGTNGGWIAYAYINSCVSVYNDNWCKSVSGQLHEVGHNLNFAHSGEDATYDDQSGMMGYSYSGSDSPRMCFNGPKSWLAGWYSDRHATFQTSQGGANYKLIGQANYTPYQENSDDKKVIIKIEAGAEDFFVMFNRKTGNNSGTVEGGNQVLVTKAGSGYSKSSLLAKLGSGGTYTTANGVKIVVNSINLSVTPAVADVTIGDGTPQPTQKPTTSAPSPSPTTRPTLPPGSTVLLACGSTAGSCRQSATNNPVQEASPNESHEVRCCHESSTNPGGWSKHSSGNCAAAGFTSTWGESAFSNNVGCVHSATYDQAQQICSNAGGRLCTKDELLADCTRGSGCNHDSDYIWSSTPGTVSTESPTTRPTQSPSRSPVTATPSVSPSSSPTKAPSGSPSQSPSRSPVTDMPSRSPSMSPSRAPSSMPSRSPSKSPSASPSNGPTESPSTKPTSSPSLSPSRAPSKAPITDSPSSSPVMTPTTASPTATPTSSPSQSPSTRPSISPSVKPSVSPSKSPSKEPTKSPSDMPTSSPTTVEPSASPSLVPTGSPSNEPSSSPSKLVQALDDTAPTPNGTPVIVNVLNNDVYPVEMEANLIVTVLANGVDRALVSSQSTHGACVVVGNQVQYNPSLGFDGQDSCQYEVCDSVSGSCDRAMVYVDVGTASKPVANDDGVDTSFDTPVTSDVLVNDAQGESLTLDVRNITTQAANGICSVVIGTPSNVKYTPNADFSGRDSCVYTTCVIGSSTACDTATLTIDVAAAPTSNPTQSPSNQPTSSPSLSPSSSPTKAPSQQPSVSPTDSPSSVPSLSPSRGPSTSPSANPTSSPSVSPTKNPTNKPTQSPSNSPTKEVIPVSQYYTVCGSTTKTSDCGGENTEADVEEKHEVRCCTDSLDGITGGDNWYKRSGCDVWGESHINGVCHAQKTFAEAENICSGVGARLCTKEELKNDCPRGTGCNFDRDQNWSSTPVTLCTDNASCGDGDSCTINTCGIDGKCTSAPSPSCSSKSIVCGSTAGACKNEKVRKASPNESHEVRCCREGPSGNWDRKYGSCASNIYGESSFSGGVGCVHSATYDEAETICSIAGGRLCTAAELLADCTRGSGCSHDHDYIWSSSPYGSSSASTQQSTGNKNKKKKNKDKLPWL